MNRLSLKLSRVAFFLATAVQAFLSGCVSEGITEREVVCPGIHTGHLQGVATDRADAVYWQFTEELVKTNMKGEILESISVPWHHGDAAYHDGKVYVAVNFGEFNQPAGKANSWVYVYDADDLSLVSKHPVPEVVHGAGGIAYHNGHFAVVGGLPKGYEENYVYLYDENLKFIKRYIIKSGYTTMGIQTADYFEGCWWFGCYGAPDNAGLLKTDDSFQLLDEYETSLSRGMIGLSNNKFLKGVSWRENGEEKWHAKLVVTCLDSNTKENNN